MNRDELLLVGVKTLLKEVDKELIDRIDLNDVERLINSLHLKKELIRWEDCFDWVLDQLFKYSSIDEAVDKFILPRYNIPMEGLFHKRIIHHRDETKLYYTGRYDSGIEMKSLLTLCNKVIFPVELTFQKSLMHHYDTSTFFENNIKYVKKRTLVKNKGLYIVYRA